MKRHAPIAILSVVCVLAFWARDRAGGPAGPIDDPGTAWHLRRISLALASHETPRYDRFQNPPVGAAVPEPALFDGMIAMAAEVALGDGGSGSSLRVVGERELEGFALRVGPLLGATTTIALFLALAGLVRGPDRAWTALLGASLYALLPIAVESDASMRIDAAPWFALLFTSSVAVALQTQGSREGIDVLQGGLIGGIVAGVALASGPMAAVFVPLAWLGHVIAVRTAGDHERAQTARRSGLFFALVAAVAVSIAASRSPTVGPASAWLRGASELAFVAAAPFLLGLLRHRADARRRLVTVVFAAGVVATLALIPAGLRELWRALEPRWDGIAFIDLRSFWSRPAGAPLSAALEDWGALALLAPFAIALVWRAEDAPVERRWLALTAAVLFTGSLLARPIAPLFACAASAIVALAWCELRSRSKAFRDRSWFVAGVVVLSLATQTLQRAPQGRDPGRADFVRAMRWMRAKTPAAGPWSVATASNDFSILAPWGLAHLVAYHARRPATVSGFGPLTVADRFREGALALVETDLERMLVRMRGLGAAYVVAGTVVCDTWPELVRAAGFESGTGPELRDSVLHRLTSGGVPHPGLERVHEVPGPAGADGGPPRVALFRVEASERDESGPVLRSR